MSAFGGYCERVDPGWFAEPLNTMAALAFVLAAVQLWRHGGESGLSWKHERRVLALLVGGIGLTSIAVHTTGYAVWFWLDILLYAAFMLAFWDGFLRHVWGLSGWTRAGIWFLSLVVVASILSILPLGNLAGALLFAPLVLLIVTGVGLCRTTDRRLARDFLLAGALLVVGLMLRVLDDPLCDWLVVGTHWLWHLFAAGVLFVLVDGLGRHLRARSEQTS